MSDTTERYLTAAKGNKFEAAASLALDLMRGREAESHLGYSIGSALMAVTDQFNLTKHEVSVVAEHVVNRTKAHYSETRRPLVIVGIGGGLVQWTVEKPGLGTPRVHVLDYDKEGCEPNELAEFIDAIQNARNDLMEYGDPEDADTTLNMNLSIAEYQEMLVFDAEGVPSFKGDGPSRYR